MPKPSFALATQRRVIRFFCVSLLRRRPFVAPPTHPTCVTRSSRSGSVHASRSLPAMWDAAWLSFCFSFLPSSYRFPSVLSVVLCACLSFSLRRRSPRLAHCWRCTENRFQCKKFKELQGKKERYWKKKAPFLVAPGVPLPIAIPSPASCGGAPSDSLSSLRTGCRRRRAREA